MAVDEPKKGRGAKNRVAAQSAKPDSTEAARTDALSDPEQNWADEKESKPYIEALKLYTLVRAAFENKNEQCDAISEYWNIFHAQPDDNLQYAGNSQGYIPAVRDAIHARSKRALKQLFPVNNKHVEAVSTDERDPTTQKALLEHYIRKLDMREIVRSDLVSGDVTGQWNLMIDWMRDTRVITKLVRRNPPVQMGGELIDELEDVTDEEETTEDEEIEEQGPEVVTFATEDIAVIPPTCADLQKAKAVAIKLRLSKDRIKEMVDEGVFILPPGTDLDAFIKPEGNKDKHNRPKKNVNDAGIKTDGTNKYALVYMVWTKLDFDDDDERKRSAIVYFAGEEEIIGLIKNPLWSGKIPIMSRPVDPMPGSFFGKSKVEPVKFLQWQLCDFWNMGQDSAMYSLLPIWRVDQNTVPQWASLTMGLAAIWPAPKDSIEPLTSPQLWKDSAGICDLIKRQIWESMDVNEQMMGRMPSGRKNNAMIGQMQQNQDINITDHATRYENVMLNPLLEMLFEFDQQFRETPLMVEQAGEIGVKAQLTEVPVQQWGVHYRFCWTGTEYMMTLQRQQQQIAWLNVLKGIPPQMMPGKRLDVSPVMVQGTENIFGPELAPRILVDTTNQFTIPAEVENELLHNAFDAPVHPADDDTAHLQSHMVAANTNGDPLGIYKQHMMKHMEQLKGKQQQMMAAQMPPGLPGAPGGAGPGVAGAPRPGAMPAPGGPRPGQNPPGAIPHDNMMDPGIQGRG